MAKQPAVNTAAGTAKNKAIVAIARRRRVGSGAGAAAVTPHGTAAMGKGLPATNGAEAQGSTTGTIPVKAHTRAAPARKA